MNENSSKINNEVDSLKITQFGNQENNMFSINLNSAFNQNFNEPLTKRLIKKNHPLLSSAIKLDNNWFWDRNSKSECISLSENSKIVYFFDDPYTISRGTAGIRGNKAVEEGVNYFEVLIKEPLHGTAVMVGFGTDEVCLHYENFEYVNLVGIDSNSWGLSHKGTIWHNGLYKKYCEPFFDKELSIGVLLNTHDKTLHFFINGVYQGLAFSNVNLENKKLYPMLSSTATDIEIELIGSFKLAYSLQDLCCQKIVKICKDYDTLPLAKRIINYLKEF